MQSHKQKKQKSLLQKLNQQPHTSHSKISFVTISCLFPVDIFTTGNMLVISILICWVGTGSPASVLFNYFRAVGQGRSN
jgi:hypothetical protein